MIKVIFFLVIFFSFNVSIIFSQKIEKIKFQKNTSTIYFYQKGVFYDTISENFGNSFYLLVPDSIKKDITIFTENGRLVKTSNDSIVKLYHMSGLNYESQYIIKESSSQAGFKKIQKQFQLISLINGTSNVQKNKIIIKFTSKKESGLILENTFFYKN
jgi:hypothetical protein